MALADVLPLIALYAPPPEDVVRLVAEPIPSPPPPNPPNKKGKGPKPTTPAGIAFFDNPDLLVWCRAEIQRIRDLPTDRLDPVSKVHLIALQRMVAEA